MQTLALALLVTVGVMLAVAYASRRKPGRVIGLRLLATATVCVLVFFGFLLVLYVAVEKSPF